MHTYIGNETFLVNGSKESITINDFWRWAYSDFTNNINRSVLAEFIVASSLDIIQTDCESFRDPWRPFDLLYDMKYRVDVKAAGYVQSHSAKHPDHISFSIAPARIPTETGEYKPEATLQRNCDIYIFCVYTAMSVSANPLDMNLWDFYVLPTKTIDREKPRQKTITLPSLLTLDPIKCTYIELKETIDKILAA